MTQKIRIILLSVSTVAAPLQQSRKPQLEKKLADLPLFELNMAREDGEGMEMTETESISTAGTPPPSLEQLLTSPQPKNGNISLISSCCYQVSCCQVCWVMKTGLFRCFTEVQSTC